MTATEAVMGWATVMMAALLMVTGATACADSDTAPVPEKTDAILSLAKTEYENGNYAAAHQLFRPLAEQGHATAQFYLGIMFAFGQGLSQDHAEAVHWFRKAAEQGHLEAQVNLAKSYADGKGITQDYQEAKRWYERAVAQGDGDAHVNLGNLYYKGLGVPQDYGRALMHFRFAANGGSAVAMAKLGLMYKLGDGVLQDFVRAYMWFNLAGARGYEHAAVFRDGVAKQMTPDQIAEAERLAREWKPKSEHTEAEGKEP